MLELGLRASCAGCAMKQKYGNGWTFYAFYAERNPKKVYAPENADVPKLIYSKGTFPN